MLEDGRLTDNKGRIIDFSNVMLILTSNVGSRKILQMAGGDEGGSAEQKYDRVRTAVKAELGAKFRPEFLNRLDEVIVFEALDTDQVSSVADLMLKELVSRCEDNEVTLTCTKRLTAAVVDQGYSATYGARPLRRAVQRLCEDAVAEAMLSGFVSSGDKLELDAGVKDGQIKLKNGRGMTKVESARGQRCARD